jgi:hypothetical protein
MSRIIQDFINCARSNEGVGYFESNILAVRYSRSITRSQRRKWNRRGTLPVDFLRYLRAINAIPDWSHVPERNRTVHWLLDLLWETPERNREERSEGEILRVEILRDLGLLPKTSMASGGYIYRKLEPFASTVEK